MGDRAARGAALEFEGDPQPVELQRGSYLHIPAHAKHRVASTGSAVDTVWLAIHYRE